MHDNTQDNQQFIDAARERGEDTFMYMDPKSGECLLVSGGAASICLLSEIVDDYEMLCAVVEAVDAELIERWRKPCWQSASGAGESDRQRESSEQRSTHGESEHA